jgi:hypothetical protein
MHCRWYLCSVIIQKEMREISKLNKSTFLKLTEIFYLAKTLSSFLWLDFSHASKNLEKFLQLWNKFWKWI